MEVSSQTTPRLLMSLIRVLASLEKTIPMGRLHMLPLQWYLKTNWQYPQSLDLKISVSNLLLKHLQWWKDPNNVRVGCPLHPEEHNILIFTDASNQGWGAHLENMIVSGSSTNQEKSLHINVLELKAVFLALKKLSKHNSKQKNSDSNRQRHCGQLSEQRRGNTFMGHVSPCLAHPGLLESPEHAHKSQTYSGLSQCHSRQSLQEGQNNTDRVVSSSSNIHSNLQSLAHTNGGHVCHQNESQTSTLCLTSSRCKCTEHRCTEHLLGGSGRLCLLSYSAHTKGHSENEHLQVQNDCSGPSFAHDALVLGSSESIHQTSITASSLASSVKTTIQSQIPSESVVSESSCLAPRHHSESLESFSEQVADRIKAPQRPSSRRLYESRWSIFELWCQQNQVVSSEPTISKIADFLNHLFTVKNLKPATIAGYKTAIADHLGHLGQEVSKSLDLNRLIASFYRDKPAANRGMPSWDLSLVLLALTKGSF